MKMKLENLFKANRLLTSIYENTIALKSMDGSGELFICGKPPITWNFVVTNPVTHALIVDALRKDIAATIEELKLLGFECDQEEIDNLKPGFLEGKCGCS